MRSCHGDQLQPKQDGRASIVVLHAGMDMVLNKLHKCNDTTFSVRFGARPGWIDIYMLYYAAPFRLLCIGMSSCSLLRLTSHAYCLFAYKCGWTMDIVPMNTRYYG